MAIDETRSQPERTPWDDPEGPELGAGINFTDPDSPLSKYYFHTSHVVAVALLGLFFLFLNFVPLWHTDIWGHLKYGQFIVQTGQLPEGNPFAPLMEESVPSNHYSWLSQTTFYLIYHVGETIAGGDSVQQMTGGIDALRFTHAFLVLARMVLLLLVFYRITNSMPVAIAGIVLMTLIGGGGLAIFRPQVLGELCFAIALFALSRTKLTWAAVCWLPALMVLWANLHGSYAIGLILLALFVIGRTIETGRKLKTWKPKTLFKDATVYRLFIVFAASVLGIAILNPAGPWIYLRTLAMTNHPVVLVMDEWKPLTFNSWTGGHWAYLATLVLVIGSVIYARQLPSVTAILITLFFATQPLIHQRALVWWLLIFPWVMLPLWVKQPADFLIGWVPESTASFRKTMVAGALVVVIFLWSIPGQWIIAGKPSGLERSLSQGTPWKLTLALKNDDAKIEPRTPGLHSWLAKHYPDGRYQGNVFATETLGDYLVWDLPKESPVFVYAHVHMISPQHWNKVVKVRYGMKEWESILNESKINVIIVEAEQNPYLRKRLQDSSQWEILLDETGSTTIRDKRCRLLVAVRKEPIS